MPEGSTRPTLPVVVGQSQQKPDSLQLELLIPAELWQLQGHFPEAPIVPGVALTDWAVRFSADSFDYPLQVAQLSRIKFKQVLQPNDAVCLSLKNQPDKRITVFSYDSETAAHASGVIHWR